MLDHPCVAIVSNFSTCTVLVMVQSHSCTGMCNAGALCFNLFPGDLSWIGLKDWHYRLDFQPLRRRQLKQVFLQGVPV